MSTSSFRRHLRPLLQDSAILASLCVALLAPSASRAALISQTISFDSIAPFGSFTDGSFTLGGWDQPFPVDNIAGVERFYLSFSSTDAFYQAQLGPLGGVPWIEFGYRDDSAARYAFASMGPGAESVSFGSENPEHFNRLKDLLADGALTIAPGGYERFPGSSDNFSFGGISSFTLSFELPDGSGGPGSTVPGNNVPEPHSLALLLAALAAAGATRRRQPASQPAGQPASRP